MAFACVAGADFRCALHHVSRRTRWHGSCGQLWPDRKSTIALFECHSAELSHSSKVADRRRNTPTSAHNRSESLCAGLWGTEPDILGLVWLSLRRESGSKSKISGRILESFRGLFRSAEFGALESVSRAHFQ